MPRNDPNLPLSSRLQHHLGRFGGGNQEDLSLVVHGCPTEQGGAHYHHPSTSCDSSHGHEVLRDHDGHNALQVSLADGPSLRVACPASASIGALIPPPPLPHPPPSTARQNSMRRSKTSTRWQSRRRRTRRRPTSTFSPSPKGAAARGASKLKPR